MRYRVTHITEYQYTEPMAVCHNQVHLAPRRLPHQQCHAFQLTISPEPSDRARRADYFGNPVEYFAILDAHMGLTVTAMSDVEVHASAETAPKSTPAWDALADQLAGAIQPVWLRARQMTFDSAYAHRSPRFFEYAAESFLPGRPVLEAAIELTERIHRDFRYDPRATELHTTVAQSFEQRAGVCQDFAHVLIACLRSLHLAARYVSGYLRTEPPPGAARLVGADASHAWASVFCGAAGWVDLDPTNNLVPSTDHVTVAWGRDYGDVCPIQGVAVGGGRHRMSVSVDVNPLDT